jgi:thioredoxin
MTSPHITIVNENNFENEVLKSDKLVLIDFYADWCGPCKALAPTLEKFAEEHQADVKVVKVNVDDSQQLAQAFGIQSIPTLVTMKDGQALYGEKGNLPMSELEKLVTKSLQTPPPPPATKGPSPQ